MRVRYYLALALGCAGMAMLPNPAHAKTVELAPSTPWNIDYAPNKCRLARAFGENDGRHLLFFEQFWPGAEVGLTAAGPQFKRFQSRKRTYLNTSPEREPTRTEPFAGEVEGIGKAVIYSSINLADDKKSKEDPDDTAPQLEQLDTQWASSARFISLKQGGREVVFETGPLDEAFGALNQCTKTLLTDWGVDAERHETARRLPVWENEEKIVRRIASNYPRTALNRGEQAILRMRVMINEKGDVTDCFINEATSTEKLQSPACEPMADAKFLPALDAVGKPFKSYYVTGITYQIGR